jgi:hypothetical protein
MPTQTLSLKHLASVQLILGTVVALAVAWLWSFRLGASIGIGAGLMIFNVMLLGWSWQRLIAKKSVALTVLLIVIKYAVLLGSIYFMARTDWFSAVGAGLGIVSFVMAAVVYAAISF